MGIRIKYRTLEVKKPAYISDAWHIAKSSMIIFLGFAMLTFKSIGYWWMDMLLFGAIWNFTFNLFYKKILYR